VRPTHEVEKVKYAATQSVGVVVTTKYSLEFPLTCQTGRDGDCERHDTEGSSVAKLVSWPTGIVPWVVGIAPLTLARAT
jgi:hypothetical protein